MHINSVNIYTIITDKFQIDFIHRFVQNVRQKIQKNEKSFLSLHIWNLLLQNFRVSVQFLMRNWRKALRSSCKTYWKRPFTCEKSSFHHKWYSFESLSSLFHSFSLTIRRHVWRAGNTLLMLKTLFTRLLRKTASGKEAAYDESNDNLTLIWPKKRRKRKKNALHMQNSIRAALHTRRTFTMAKLT